ncbi:exonuclease VIII [Escherichia coli]|nr:exonuclease [Escherichia coli O91:H21 str. 2009C-3740]TJR05558.1 exonuclease VIII [Escherichia coli]
MKKQTRALLMLSCRQQHKLIQWRRRNPILKKMKSWWKLNHL